MYTSQRDQRTVINPKVQYSVDSIPSDQERYNEERTIISCTKIFPKQIEETRFSIESHRDINSTEFNFYDRKLCDLNFYAFTAYKYLELTFN